MKFPSQIGLGTRLGLGFGTILALLLGMAILSLVRIQDLSETLERITVRNATTAQVLHQLGRGVARYVQALGDLGSTDMEGGPAVLLRMQTALADYDKAQSSLAGLLPARSRGQELLQQANTKADSARKLMVLGDQLAQGRGTTALAFQIRNEYSKDTAMWSAHQQEWSAAIDTLSDWQDEVNANLSVAATSEAASTRRLIIAGTLLGLLLGTGLATWLVRDARSAIQAAVEATRRIAGHDLSQAIQTRRGDEIGALLRALEDMRLNLHELAAGVRATSEDISNASSEIAQGSQNLSTRTDDAANTLQITLNAMSDLDSSLTSTTTAAREAHALSAQTSEAALRSGAAMAQVVVTMNEIDVASRKIGDIISIIDGIAFQTNILALNAAVEAARAGEQGRGFAVVASEVRTLAGRSAEAAREIKLLVGASLEKVASGTTQVGRAGSMTEEVTSSVQRVLTMLAHMSTAITEQHDHIGGAKERVGQLDLLAHQNATLAEQSAAAAASMRQQAGQLTELVGKFELSPAPHPLAQMNTNTRRLLK